MAAYSTIRPLLDGAVLIVELLDRRLVEPDHVARVSAEISDAVRSHRCPRVILDFHAVEFLSSAMLSAIIEAHALAQDQGGGVALCGLTRDLSKMFKMMRLDSRLKLCDSRDKAVESLNRL